METKNYLQFEGNKVIGFSTLNAFVEDEVPGNLMEAGYLIPEDTLGKFYNPDDGQFYEKYDFKTGEYTT